MNLKKYVTEFIGTFFLVLTVCLTTFDGNKAGAFYGLAIGASLMVMIFMGGHISGAHYNPAVSLAVFIRGKLSVIEIAPYMISQVLGAIVAAALASYVAGNNFSPVQPAKGVDVPVALLAEFLYTFALALVVLNVATSKGTSGNSFYGLAIGFTVVVGAYAAGPISGGAFNPAVGIGPNVIAGNWEPIWLYLVGPLAGGAAAGAVYKVQHAGESD